MVPTIATRLNEDNVVISIFAKAPIPGEVKTRLIPALGDAHAAMLHMALVERAIVVVQDTNSETELCCAPDIAHSFFEACEEDFDVTLSAQGEGDLGTRMLRALDRLLVDADAAIIIGADCVALTTKHLLSAIDALQTHDVVLIPAEDGGYVLIGARKTHAAMFAGIAWGGETVLAAQRSALGATGLSWHEMETLWDIDRPEDLPRVKALKMNPPLEFFWPV
jgi:uncharacterized protein